MEFDDDDASSLRYITFILPLKWLYLYFKCSSDIILKLDYSGDYSFPFCRFANLVSIAGAVTNA